MQLWSRKDEYRLDSKTKKPPTVAAWEQTGGDAEEKCRTREVGKYLGFREVKGRSASRWASR
jgi:hypothetical protein